MADRQSTLINKYGKNSPMHQTRAPVSLHLRNGRIAGRPPKFTWDAFWCHIVEIADTPDGLPMDRAELQRHMMDWCAEQWADDAPTDSTVREKLAKLKLY